MTVNPYQTMVSYSTIFFFFFSMSRRRALRGRGDEATCLRKRSSVPRFFGDEGLRRGVRGGPRCREKSSGVGEATDGYLKESQTKNVLRNTGSTKRSTELLYGIPCHET